MLQPTKTPLERASTYPSKGLLYTPQKGLYITLKKASTYPSKGHLHTPQKGPHIPLKRALTYL